MHFYDFLHGLQNGEYQFAEMRTVDQPDRILKGKRCEVKCYLVSRDEEGVEWHFAPYAIPVGSRFNPSSAEERIAHAISKIPNADYFINFTSFDQVFYWIACRDYSVKFALCFWSEEDIQNEYLLRELQSGNIDQFSYDYGRAEARMYKSLWKILRAREQKIELICKENWGYPFNSIHEFCVEVIREDLEGEFTACLKRRYIYKTSENKQLAKLKRKAHKGTISVNERKKMYRLIDQYVPFAVWLNRFLLIAEHLAQKDDLVKQNLNAYRESLDTLAKLQIQRNCDPKLRHHVIPSHTWEKGQYRREVLSWDA
jgi:hypothetical protein